VNQRNGPRHGGPYHPRPNGGDAPLDHRRHGQGGSGGGGGGGGEIVFGVEPIRELLAVAPRAIRTLYFKAGAHPRFATEIEAVRAAGGNIVSSADDALARMAGSEGRHQGLVAAIREYVYTELEQMLEERPDPVVVIDGVTDPRNLGAILRSAEGAGVKAAVIARDRTSGLTPAAVKASAGAWAHLKVARCGNVAQTLEALKAVGYWTAALAPEGDVSIYELDVTRRLALVLGSEGQGVRELVKKTADFVVGIPMYGRVASLNVSVAAAIALFELARRRGVEPSSKMPQ
jgi:23S rRNA (guanosine2251-2'-O)-methyltransferase